MASGWGATLGLVSWEAGQIGQGTKKSRSTCISARRPAAALTDQKEMLGARVSRPLRVRGKQANDVVVHDVDKEHQEEDQAHLNEALLES